MSVDVAAGGWKAWWRAHLGGGVTGRGQGEHHVGRAGGGEERGEVVGGRRGDGGNDGGRGGGGGGFLGGRGCGCEGEGGLRASAAAAETVMATAATAGGGAAAAALGAAEGGGGGAVMVEVPAVAALLAPMSARAVLLLRPGARGLAVHAHVGWRVAARRAALELSDARAKP